jgi:hypothetical protein
MAIATIFLIAGKLDFSKINFYVAQMQPATAQTIWR